MQFQVSDATPKSNQVSDGSENPKLNSVDILQPSKALESDSKTNNDLVPNITFDNVSENGSSDNPSDFKLDENGTAEIVSKDKGLDNAAKTKNDKNIDKSDDSKPYPPSIEITDGSKESMLETKTELNESEQKTLTKLSESIDSADVDSLNKTVKEFANNPESLARVAEHLNQELKPYGMYAKVESLQNTEGSRGSGNSTDSSLILGHRYQTGDHLHSNKITFSTRSGEEAYESESSENIDGSGGGGGGGPVRTSSDPDVPTVSHVLRRMSHDRTH